MMPVIHDSPVAKNVRSDIAENSSTFEEGAALTSDVFYDDVQRHINLPLDFGMKAVDFGIDRTFLGGDFYCENQDSEKQWDLSSGLNFDEDCSVLGDCEGSLCKTPFFDHCYGMQENIERGLTLGMDGKFGVMCNGPLDMHVVGKMDTQEFRSTNQAPTLSQDAEEYVAPTTLYLKGHLPFEVANKLLAFLRHAGDGCAEEVDQENFTILAQVVLDGLYCKANIRIYQHEGSTIVEFRRWSGDGIAFSRLYRRASMHLQGRVCDVAVPRSAKFACTEAIPSNEVVSLLLDLVENAADISSKAEVASILADIVQDPLMAAELRKPHACHTLRRFDTATDFSIAFPMSQVFSRL
jgi:hypothetical protein